MATLNGVKAIYSGSHSGMEDNVTQSLEHIVLNAIKQKAKQVKKGQEESTFPSAALSHAALSATLPELHASLGKWRESGGGKLNRSAQSETHTEVRETVNISATEAPFGKRIPPSKTTVHHDLSVFSANVGEMIAVAGGLQGQSAAAALLERHDIQHRAFTGDTLAASADNRFAGAGRQSLPAEAILRNIGNAVSNEAASESQLLYRFSDWGDGHQVNVLLGGHTKAPHVLHVSDPLVHQRLADYQGQGQSEPEWVFSEDDEQPNKAHNTFADEENA